MTDSTSDSVVRHYSGENLEQKILTALATAGKDVNRLTPEDLAPVDEFHIGGRAATVELAAQAQFTAGQHLLDVGSGLGGASRYFAHEHRCRVTGIDLTQSFVQVAGALARRIGFEESRVAYRQASALDLPFAAATFDGAYMLHVGMNIADKTALARAVARVLKPGAGFAIYDVMRADTGDLAFPVPWATTAETSFLAEPHVYRQALEAAGFRVRHERNRRDFAIEFFRRMRAQAAQSGPPPLGLHLVMGIDAPQKIANMVAAVERGLIAPVEMIVILE